MIRVCVRLTSLFFLLIVVVVVVFDVLQVGSVGVGSRTDEAITADVDPALGTVGHVAVRGLADVVRFGPGLLEVAADAAGPPGALEPAEPVEEVGSAESQPEPESTLGHQESRPSQAIHPGSREAQEAGSTAQRLVVEVENTALLALAVEEAGRQRPGPHHVGLGQQHQPHEQVSPVDGEDHGTGDPTRARKTSLVRHEVADAALAVHTADQGANQGRHQALAVDLYRDVVVTFLVVSRI